MSDKVSFSSILILNKNDMIHSWILYNYSKRKRLILKEVNVKDLKNKNFKYTSILSKKELIYIYGDDEDILNNLGEIKKIDRRKRMLAISVEKKIILDKIYKAFSKEDVKIFPKTKKYEDRMKIVDKIIKRKGIECDKKKTKQELRKNMVRSTVEWEDLFLLWEVLDYRGRLMTMSDIEEVFDDVDFYNLDRFILKIFKGDTKYKNHKVMSYFLDVKEYSVRWMLGKIKEEYLNIGLFYQAYRGGVLLIPEKERRLKERVENLNWDTGLRLLDFNEIEQQKYLDFVKSVSYKHFLRISEYLYNNKGADKKEIYKFIEDVKDLRREYSDDV